MRLALVTIPSSKSRTAASFAPADQPKSSALMMSLHPLLDALWVCEWVVLMGSAAGEPECGCAT
jgi:hypothetical protein